MDLQKIAGGIGCDIVTGTLAFTARMGKIYCIIPREENSGLTSIKERRSADLTVTVTSRSYIGTNTLQTTDMIFPDYPVTEITPSAGSFIVYYAAL